MVHIWMEEYVNLAILIAKLVLLHHIVQAAKEVSSVIKDHASLDVLRVLAMLVQIA